MGIWFIFHVYLHLQKQNNPRSLLSSNEEPLMRWLMSEVKCGFIYTPDCSALLNCRLLTQAVF